MLVSEPRLSLILVVHKTIATCGTFLFLSSTIYAGLRPPLLADAIWLLNKLGILKKLIHEVNYGLAAQTQDNMTGSFFDQALNPEQ